MTDQEKRSQRVQSRIDLEDAEANLVHLRGRANRYADSISVAMRKLKDNAALDPSSDDFNVESEVKMRISPEEFGLLKSSGDTATAMIAECRHERQKVIRLREEDLDLSRAAGITRP